MDDPDEGGRGGGLPKAGAFGYVEVETQFITMRSHFFFVGALVGSASEVEAFAIWCEGGGGDAKADDLVVEAGTALVVEEGGVPDTFENSADYEEELSWLAGLSMSLNAITTFPNLLQLPQVAENPFRIQLSEDCF